MFSFGKMLDLFFGLCQVVLVKSREYCGLDYRAHLEVLQNLIYGLISI